MSKIEVNAIEPQCGTTLTLGASGDTVTLGSGANQSGFGRTGTVDWQTGSIKTATFTAVNGEGYFANTTSSAFSMTLPASPSAGDIVAVSDYAKTFDTNNLTVARNGSNIEGDASNLILSAQGVSMTFVYVDATKGWKVINAGSESDKTNAEFVGATGGTISTCGDFKIHTFTGPGTFTVCKVGNNEGSATVDYLVIAGGGGSGYGEGIGGGGAGGYRESSGAASGCYSRSPLGACVSALPVSVQDYPITVGAGGSAVPASIQQGNDGSNSIFSTITSTGGGGGGAGGGQPVPNGTGRPGGSGGGGGGRGDGGTRVGGSGNTPPVSPPQGNNGGAATTSTAAPDVDSGGGGGGATAAGTNGTASSSGGNGGNGATSSINGTPTTRGGGGAGGSQLGPMGTGGTGGGGSSSGEAGTANTGGGGAGQTGTNGSGGAGGSGIVIIRYKFQ